MERERREFVWILWCICSSVLLTTFRPLPLRSEVKWQWQWQCQWREYKPKKTFIGLCTICPSPHSLCVCVCVSFARRTNGQFMHKLVSMSIIILAAGQGTLPLAALGGSLCSLTVYSIRVLFYVSSFVYDAREKRKEPKRPLSCHWSSLLFHVSVQWHI